VNKENISINIHYMDLKKFMIELYKEAVNSYVDLAESVVEEKMHLLIEKNQLASVKSVKFNIVNEEAEKAMKNKDSGIVNSWATINESISVFNQNMSSQILPSYNNYLENLTGTVEITGTSASNSIYTVSGDTIMFSGSSDSRTS
jgi:hypothetical protein